MIYIQFVARIKCPYFYRKPNFLENIKVSGLFADVERLSNFSSIFGTENKNPFSL